jgi:hypothetical protein
MTENREEIIFFLEIFRFQFEDSLILEFSKTEIPGIPAKTKNICRQTRKIIKNCKF